MKKRLRAVLSLSIFGAWNVLAQNILETHESFKFGPGQGKGYHVALKP